MPKQQKRGRKGHLNSADRRYARTFSNRKYDTQLDKFGQKLDEEQDKFITKPSRRGQRHKQASCPECGKQMLSDSVKGHRETACGASRRDLDADRAQVKWLGRSRTYKAQQRWF